MGVEERRLDSASDGEGPEKCCRVILRLFSNWRVFWLFKKMVLKLKKVSKLNIDHETVFDEKSCQISLSANELTSPVNQTPSKAR